MKRFLRHLICLALLFGNVLVLPVQADGGSVSLLEPDSSLKTVFRNRIDAMDPTPETNPQGQTYPGYRGRQQLVIYTPAFGMQTQTNGYGQEAVVSDGVVQGLYGGDSLIPPSGFVVSGQGATGQWIQRILKPGASVRIDPETRQLTVEYTPRVYLAAVDEALRSASQASSPGEPLYHQRLAEARQCRSQLALQASGGVTPELVNLATNCQKLADKAYYRSIPVYSQGFRGIWVRPVERSPEAIRNTIAELKAANIQDIFLETYYQGRTLYPSQVMAEYGLPAQHTPFEGGDPLKIWIDEAHHQGIRIHAWVQTFFAGNQRAGIEPYGPILEKYPHWANVQRSNITAATPMPSSIEAGHYFLDPANPEVKAFLEKLLLEMVTRYSFDGLNLDYIRYPASHPPSNPSFVASTWGYTPVARQAFMAMLEEERKQAEAKRLEELKKAGKPIPVKKSASAKKMAAKPKPEAKPKTDPNDFTASNPLWSRWVDWRKAQVSTFVQDISQKAHGMNPNLQVTAVVFPPSDAKLQVKLQDWPRWAKEGWIQALTPIGLSNMYQDSLTFKRLTEGKVPVYVGVFGMYNRNTPVELLTQIHDVHRAGLSGVVLFERSRLDAAYKEALLEGAFRN